jgi:60 kDa SS-A/Ro ribonucleoprotein
LAYQVVKYQSRDGWSHRDILRKSHAQAVNDEMNQVFHWITQGVNGDIDKYVNIPMIYGFELAKKATNEQEIVELIKQYNLPREAIPTQFLGKKVYEALLPTMPMTALIRNLGNLSKVGILETGNFDEINMVVDKITNMEALAKARVHPIALLMALKTYAQGHGFRGNNTWNVVPQVVKALDDAFYMAFKNIEPTGKRILIALDVSGSMSCGIQNAPFISCRSASSAMAMVTMKTERNYGIIGFTGGGWYNTGQELNNVTELKVNDGMSLNEVDRYVDSLDFGGTDCALPALWAAGMNKDFDAIFVYTDSETWAGTIQPSEAMERYRNKVGHDVKLVVVGMASNNFTIADPEDKSSLDVVGFDSNAPSIMSDFITDKF